MRNNKHTTNRRQSQKMALPPVTGSEAAFLKFIGQAHALDPKEVLPSRGNVVSMYRNVAVGKDAVLAERERILSALPEEDLAALSEVTELALGLVFAASQVDPAPLSAAAPDLPEAKRVRRRLAMWAKTFAADGLVNAAEVRVVPKGTSFAKLAQALIDLAALFRRHPELMAKSGVTAADVARASELGTRLIERPQPAPKSPPNEAADVRDRMYTLLATRYRAVRKVGAYLFGAEQLAKAVPALGRTPRKRAKKHVEATPPAPAAPATPAPGAPATPKSPDPVTR